MWKKRQKRRRSKEIQKRNSSLRLLGETLEPRIVLAGEPIIAGHVYNDLDLNGSQDVSDLAIINHEVYLDLDNDGQLDADEPATSTDANGDYSFVDPPTGTYTVRSQSIAGWEVLTPQTVLGGNTFHATGDHTIANFLQFPAGQSADYIALKAGPSQDAHDDVIYVVDDDKIDTYNATTGVYVGPFTTAPTPGRFNDLVFTSDGTMFVAYDGPVPAIYEFDTLGAQSSVIPFPSNGVPVNMTLVSDTELLVTDVQNQQLLRFDTTKKTFDPISLDPPPADLLIDVATAPNGLGFIVTDSVVDLVHWYDAQGRRQSSSFMSAPTSVQIYQGKLFVDGATVESFELDQSTRTIGSSTTIGIPPGGFDLLPGFNAAYPVTITASETYDLDFGIAQPASIDGVVDWDPNRDGVLQSADPHQYTDLYVDLNNNNSLDASEPVATTNATGQFSFEGLAPGLVVVRQVPNSNWDQTAPISFTTIDAPTSFDPTTFTTRYLDVAPGGSYQANLVHDFPPNSGNYVSTESSNDGTYLYALASDSVARLVAETGTLDSSSFLTPNPIDPLVDLVVTSEEESEFIYVTTVTGDIHKFNSAGNAVPGTSSWSFSPSALLPLLTADDDGTIYASDGDTIYSLSGFDGSVLTKTEIPNLNANITLVNDILVWQNQLLVTDSAQVHRYDLTENRWLSPIAVDSPFRLNVIGSDLYVASFVSNTIERFGLVGDQAVSLGTFLSNTGVVFDLSDSTISGYLLDVAPGTQTFLNFLNAPVEAQDPEDGIRIFEEVGRASQRLVDEIVRGAADVIGADQAIPFVEDVISQVVDLESTFVELASMFVEDPMVRFGEGVTDYDLPESRFLVSTDEISPTLVIVPDTDDAIDGNQDALRDHLNQALTDAGIDSITVSTSDGLAFVPNDGGQADSISIHSLISTTTAPTDGKLPDGTSLTFEIDRDGVLETVVISPDTSDNDFAEDLVDDINEELSTLGISGIVAFPDGNPNLFDEITIAATAADIDTISITGGGPSLPDFDVNTFSLGGLGLTSSLNVGNLEFDSIGELISLLELRLPELPGNTLPQGFDLDPVVIDDALYFNFALEKSFVDSSVSFDFGTDGISLGPLGTIEVASLGDATAEVTANLNFRMGIRLSEFGLNFSVEPFTFLSELGGGVGVNILSGMTADFAAPIDGQVGGDVEFTIDFTRSSGQRLTPTFQLEFAPADLSRPATNDNFNVASLVSDLNGLLEVDGWADDLQFEKYLFENGGTLEERIQLIAKTSSDVISVSIIDANDLGFSGIQHGDFDDLSFDVGGDTFSVDLDGALTVDDILSRVMAEAPAGFEILPDGQGFSISALADVVVEQAVTDGHRSLAGLGLGILGVFTSDITAGLDLHGETLLDSVFIVPNEDGSDNLHLSACVDAGIQASGAFSKLGFDLASTNANASCLSTAGPQASESILLGLDIGASFADPNDDGLITLSEIFDAPTEILDTSGLVPSFSASGSINLTADAAATSNVFGEITEGVSADLFSLTVVGDAAGIRFEAQTGEIQDLLGQFGEVCVGDVITVLQNIATSLKADPTLGTEIPGLGLSPIEMVGFADVLLDVAADFVIEIDLPALRIAIDELNVAINNLSLELPDRPELLELGELFATLPSLPDLRLNAGVVAHLRLLDKLKIGLPTIELAFETINALIPSWDTFEIKLNAAINAGLTAAFGGQAPTVNIAFVADIDLGTPTIQERAIVVNVEFSAATDWELDPDLPTDDLGPIEFSLDAGLQLDAGVDATLGFGATLGSEIDRTLFVIADPPQLGDPAYDERLVGTEVVIHGGMISGFDGQISIGSLELLGASGSVTALSKVDQNGVVGDGGSGTEIVLTELPAADVPLILIVADNVHPEGHYTVDGNVITLDTDLTGESYEIVYHANLHVAIDTSTPSVFPNTIGAMTLDEAFGSLSITADGEVLADLDVEFLEVTTDAVDLSVDLVDPGNFTIEVNDGLFTDLFSNIDFDLKTVIAGFDAFLGVFEDGFVDEVLTNIPVIGSGFNPDESLIGELRTFLGDFEVFLCTLDTLNLTQAELDIEGFIGDFFANLPTPMNPSVDASLEVDSFEIDIDFAGEIYQEEHSFDFDIGLEGLPIQAKSDGGVAATFGYGARIVVGASREEGAYIGEETGFSIDVDAHMEVQDDGSGQDIPTSIEATLFGLELSATDILNAETTCDANVLHDSGTFIAGDIGVGLKNKLFLNDLLSQSFTSMFDVTLTADAAVNLRLAAGLGTNLPHVQTELSTCMSAGLGIEHDKLVPTITFPEDFAFQNTGINLGKLLNQHVGVVIDRVNEYIEPILPMIELLTQEIPGVTHLSKAAGKGPVTFLDLAFADHPDKAASAERFLDVLVTIADIAQSLETLDDDNSIFVLTDDYSLRDQGFDPTDPNSAAEVDVSDAQATANAEEESSGPIKSLLQQMNDVGIYPHIIQNPANIMQMLMGQPFDVIGFDLPTFELPLELSAKFPVIPIPPISVKIGFEAGFLVDLSVGYDSHGIATGNFFDGFYFGDLEDNGGISGRDIDEFGLSIGASLAALLDLGVASAGVEGKLRADLLANFRDLDGNGKVHLDELESILNTDGLQCVFDLRGELRAIISVVWEVLGADGSKPFVDQLLFSFENQCPTFELGHLREDNEALPKLPTYEEALDPDPTDSLEVIAINGTTINLAEAPYDDGMLILHAGSFAALRGPGKTSDTTEEFTVTQLEPGIMQVEGLGLDSRYSGVTSIYFDGGDHDDALILDGVTVPVIAFGGAGNDTLQGGSAVDYLHGESDADEIDGGDSADILRGGSHADIISGGSGDDNIAGGTGDDELMGNNGADVIDGEDGEDILDGGNSDIADDTLYGGPGDDVLFGFAGEDIINGDGGNDVIYAGEDDDTVDGGPGNDFLLGELGNDTIEAGSGEDFASGGEGTDTLFGDSGNDMLVGGDPLNGSAEQEDLIAGMFSDYQTYINDADDTSGNPEDLGDEIWGDGGSDLLIGDFGLDTLLGGRGNDAIVAHRILDPNTVLAEYIEGGPDNDFICGANGPDTIHGGTAETGLTRWEEDTGGQVFGGFTLTSCDFSPFMQPVMTLTTRVSGLVFSDANEDGIQDANEMGLNGWTVRLFDADGELVDVVESDSDGLYEFPNLTYGNYTVTQSDRVGGIPQLMPGYAQSWPENNDEHEVSITVGPHSEDVNFGNYYQPAKIFGIKYHDQDLNGLFENPQDAGLNGWEIQLLDEEGNFISSMSTATLDVESNLPKFNATRGWFEFDGLDPGTYWVAEVPEPDWFQTGPNLSPIQLEGSFRLLTDDGFSATKSLAIAKGLTGLTDSIRVELQLVHESMDQLDVYLVSPSGTRVDLMSNPPLTPSSSFTYYIDEAFTAKVGEIEYGPYDSFVNATAEGDLSTLHGESPNGAWELYVQDEVRGTQGRIEDWQLEISTDANENYTAVGGAPNPTSPNVHRMYSVTVTAGSQAQISFGNARISSISGRKFFDEQGDGPTEKLRGDVDGDGDADFGDFLVVSSNFGKRRATRLRGDLDGDGTVTFGDFLSLSNDFGKVVVVDKGLPGVTVYVDVNENGLFETFEPHAITNDDGDYTIGGLPSGRHHVREVVPAGFEQTFPFDDLHVVELASGAHVADVDFGNRPTGGIEGHKFEDLNANGQRDRGEPGRGGVRIYIDANNNGQRDPGELSTVTAVDDPNTRQNEAGFYSFSNIDNGRYTVREVIPAGYFQTSAGSNVIYRNNFESVVGNEWTNTSTDTSPRGDNTQLGMFDNQIVGLRVGNIPTHDEVTIEFDLVVVGSWEGIDDLDRWSLNVVNGPTLINTTFSNSFDDIPTWTNPSHPADVNADGSISRGDLDSISAGLATRGTGPLGVPTTSPSKILSGLEDNSVGFYDADGDGSLTVSDIEFVKSVLQTGGHALVVDTDPLYQQSFPDSIGGTLHPPGEGSTGTNTMGYDAFGRHQDELGTPIVETDATYHLKFTFPHQGNMVAFAFAGMGLENVGDDFEQWAIDNVVVSVPQDQHEVEVDNGIVTDIDFGNATNGEIHGTKWVDADGDGYFDDDERGLPGVHIYIDENENGVLDQGEPSTTTMEDDPDTNQNEAGMYWLKDVPPGFHWVAEEVPEELGEYATTFPDNATHRVEVLSGQVLDGINFGNEPKDNGNGSDNLDFGDAPDTYQTLLASDGARHEISTNVFLGSHIDFEPDGQPSIDALDDDRNPIGQLDDEDGIKFGPAPLTPGMPYRFDVSASTLTGFLNVWVDFTGDGKFDHPSEHVIVDAIPPAFNWRTGFITPAPNQLPGGKLPDGTYMRARFSTQAGLSWFGSAIDGEVEDYTIVTSNSGDPIDPIGPPNNALRIAAATSTDTVAAAESDGSTGTITGFKWYDVTRNARYNSTIEPLLPGVTIYSDLNGNQQLDSNEPFAVTREDIPGTPEDETGTYVLNLDEGKHFIREVTPFPYRQTFPANPDHHEVDVVAGQVHPNLDFGNTCIVNVTGVKWLDSNGNGFNNFEEMGLGGVEIYVDLNKSGFWDDGEPITVTEVDGTYSLCAPDGNIVIREITPAGYVQTFPADGGGHSITVSPNQSVGRISFGNRPTNFEGFGAIRGRKWHDDNRNGVKDPDERGLPIQIYLDLNGDGQWGPGDPLAFATSDNENTPEDEAGFYEFPVVVPGQYSVHERKPGGFEQTYPSEEFHTVTVIASETTNGVDFGNRENDSEISGIKWNDLNGNGVRDPDEPGLAGIQIYVDTNQNGRRDPGELRTFTRSDDPNTPENETGTFNVAGPNPLTKLPPGTYHVREGILGDFVPTYPNEEGLYIIDLKPGENRHLVFGNQERPPEQPGEIHGIKWLDENGNGKFDSYEVGIAGVQVFVDANDDGVRNSGERVTFTMEDDPQTEDIDETGMFWLKNLLPDTYRIREKVPTGFQQMFPLNGYHDVVLKSGETREGILFGNRPDDVDRSGEIHGRKWNDLNGNGQIDPGEKGIAGVQIFADVNGDGQFTAGEPQGISMSDDVETSVDETGQYWIQGVAPGTYDLLETVPAGFEQTWPVDGSYVVTVQPNGVHDSYRFGNRKSNSDDTGVIEGTKWADFDGNGQRDPGEPGWAGIRIFIDSNNNRDYDFGETFTFTQEDNLETKEDETGFYRFVLPAGNYQVYESLAPVAANATQTFPDGSGADIEGYLIDLVPGTIYDNRDFGNKPSGTVTGKKWLDTDGNGTWDENEGPMQNVVIYADLDSNGQLDPGEPSDTTNDNGCYELHNLPAGTYFIREVEPLGLTQSYPDGGGHEITVFPTLTFDDLDFGNYESNESISGTKFDDLSGVFGLRDDQDTDWGDSSQWAGTEFESITIYLDENDNGVWDEDGELATQTDANGNYTFADLTPGKHIIREVVPEGFAPSFPEGGRHEIILVADQNRRNVNFGNFEIIGIDDGDDIIFGGDGKDTIFGDNTLDDPRQVSTGSREDEIHGEGDSDFIDAQEENDNIWGDQKLDGGFDDEIIGGEGSDRVLQEVNADQTLTDTLITGQGSDTLDGIEYATLIDGSGGHTLDAQAFTLGGVHLTGNDGGDTLLGSPSDDILEGGGDSDTMIGGTGNDSYLFADRDIELGQSGIDSIEEDNTAAGGTDELDFSKLTVDVIADLAAGTGSMGTQSLAFVNGDSIENIIGGEGNDTLTGNDLANEISGGLGDDTLAGLGGDDTLIGGEGSDNSSGGEGSDFFLLDDNWGATETISDAGSIGTDTVDLLAATGDLDITVGALDLQFIKDTSSLSISNTIELLLLGSGDDSLHFEPGTTLASGAGLVDAGSGEDLLSYAGSTDAITVDLRDGTATGTGNNQAGGALGFEHAIGGEGDDRLQGNSLDNELDGRGGRDTILGDEGNDNLIGGDGDDSISGGPGNDLFWFAPTSTTEQDTIDEQAGEGTDTLDFSTMDVPVNIDLNVLTPLVNAVGRSIEFRSLAEAKFENVIGSQHNDSFVANGLQNEIAGLAGDDTYTFAQAIGGSVTIIEEASPDSGSDWLDFSQLIMDIVVDLNQPTNSIPTDPTTTITIEWMNAAGEFVSNIENVKAGLGHDTLIGNDLANQLIGGFGDDTLYGRNGNDQLDAGPGLNNHSHGGAQDDTYVFNVSSVPIIGLWPSITTLHEDEGTVTNGLLAHGGSDTIDLRGVEDGLTNVEFDLTLATNELIAGVFVIHLKDTEGNDAPEQFEHVINRNLLDPLVPRLP